MVTIFSPFRVLTRVSVWAVKVDEEQSRVTLIFGTNILFPRVFSTFLSLKANLILYAK